MKKLKDPLYGYIEIEDDLIKKVVDTPTFQRLRNILQTSYSPLYANAVHNRFVHSLGVYHLSKLAVQSILNSEKEIGLYIEIDELKKILEVFELASLLHDVGHAPFSHTGESFYLKDGDRKELHDKIIELTDDQQLEGEIKSTKHTAAPHELMSVIVALTSFSKLFESIDKSFFARCILGYHYMEPKNLLEKFSNQVISLLNSSIIDVDKLDYLIRDAYITGFDTISIDYIRLLNSITIYVDKEICELVFLKSGLSVIENVVYAHDAERKWIQNHPVIIYETYLLQNAITSINNKYNIFQYNALTSEGVDCNDISPLKIKLLCDGDILFLMKNIEQLSIEEYFDRGKRRRPLWKSESEYKAIFNKGLSDETYKILEDSFDELSKYLNMINNSVVIDDMTIKRIEKDIEANGELIKKDENKKDYFNSQIKTKNKILRLLKCLKIFAKNEEIEFDFVILKANQFTSGFIKPAFGELKIQFPSLNDTVLFKEVTNVLEGTKSDRDKFYYIYYQKNNNSSSININRLARDLGKFTLDETYDLP